MTTFDVISPLLPKIVPGIDIREPRGVNWENFFGHDSYLLALA